jgi:hypothetical protein
MSFGGFDSYNTRKKRLKIQTEMHFGRGFSPSVLGPVHTVGKELYGAGIDCVDQPFEAPRHGRIFVPKAKIVFQRL